MYFLNGYVGREIFTNLSAFEKALEAFDNISLLYLWFRDPEVTGVPTVTLTFDLFDKYRGYDRPRE